MIARTEQKNSEAKNEAKEIKKIGERDMKSTLSIFARFFIEFSENFQKSVA